jgi:HK97 family phage portal protein
MLRWLKHKLFPEGAKALDIPYAPAGPPPFLGGGGLAGRGRQLAAYQGWVFAAVNVIARRVAGVPLRLYPAGGGEKIGRHPALELLSRPNPVLTGRQLRLIVTLHLELTGMAFVLKSQNALGRPAELWPLSPADLVEIEAGPDTSRPITGFLFNGPEGRQVRYRPEEVLYFRHPSPASLLYGASPIQAMAHAYDIDLAVRVYQKNFFRNSARPEVVLATDQRLTEEEARRILTRWNQKHQGLERAFAPTVLDGGLKAQTLTFSQKDFQFMELAGWTQDNILAAYGVPAGKLGLVKDVNRANALGIDITFNSECVRPRLELIEDVLTRFLLPDWGRNLELRHDNPVPTDRAQAHQEAMAQLDRGAITINEFRAGRGLPPVAWGDEPLARPQPAAPPRPGAEPEPPAEPEDGAGDKPAAGDSRPARAAALAAEHYPRLAARFHGWSASRVRQALAREPELLAPLVPAGLPDDYSKCLKQHYARCLARDLGLVRAIQTLPQA